MCVCFPKHIWSACDGESTNGLRFPCSFSTALFLSLSRSVTQCFRFQASMVPRDPIDLESDVVEPSTREIFSQYMHAMYSKARATTPFTISGGSHACAVVLHSSVPENPGGGDLSTTCRNVGSCSSTSSKSLSPRALFTETSAGKRLWRSVPMPIDVAPVHLDFGKMCSRDHPAPPRYSRLISPGTTSYIEYNSRIVSPPSPGTRSVIFSASYTSVFSGSEYGKQHGYVMWRDRKVDGCMGSRIDRSTAAARVL